MTTKSTTNKPKAVKPRKMHDARTKCEAVLALWTESRKPAELCRELEVTWAQLQAWQQRALDAMLEALAPRTSRESARLPALSPRLESLLARQAGVRRKTLSKLGQRLEAVRQGPSATAETSASRGET